MSGDTTMRAWAASEDLILWRQYHAGVPIARIDVPGRTQGACIGRVQTLIKEGLLVARGPVVKARRPVVLAPLEPGGKRKQRACLRCRAVFLSEHAGHRICTRCRSHPPEGPSDDGYAVAGVRVRA